MEEPSTEREWWELFSTQTPHSMKWKGHFDRQYRVVLGYMQEKGGLREVVRTVGKHALEGEPLTGYFDGLSGLHPRAFPLLVEYGVEAKPFIWDKLPFAEPTQRGCYGNSFAYQRIFNRQMRKEGSGTRLTYVEGIALSARSAPVLHAWNSVAAQAHMAIDWTWYAITGWALYLGLPLTQRQYGRLRHLAYPAGPFHLLLARDVFPLIEKPLTHILERENNRSC